MTIDELLKLALQKGATDVHLKSGVTPVIRKNGSLRPLQADIPPLNHKALEAMALGLMDETQRAHFREFAEVDLGYGITGLGRFRVSVFRQRGSIGIVVRNVPFKVPDFKSLNLPPVISQLARAERGLILVTGIAGSGKSSTLAAMIDDINNRENKHILTIEDPIEYLIRDKKSLITQREIGVDSTSFARALRAALRQDPDVILIGEMRDQETVEAALLAAETGHLVFSTLHTLDAPETINRILGVFEGSEQRQVRSQLAGVLKGVISQRLATRKDGQGMVPAVEVLVNTPRVREIIEDESRTNELRQVIEESDAYGMQSFDQCLLSLVNRDMITFEEALLHCARPEDLRIRYEGITPMDGKKWSNEGSFDNKVDDKWQNITEVEIVMPVDVPQKPRAKKNDTGDGKK